MPEPTNIDMIAFLKRYSAVENSFVDDFFALVDPDAPDTHSVDLEKVSKWLGTPKFTLMRTLKHSYVKDVDYTVSVPDNKPLGRGYATLRIVMLTPDCFKTLCMQSHTKQAERVRAYFIAVERTLFQYRTEIVRGMRERIQQLELNQKPVDASLKITGVIYVILAAMTETLYKIGRTGDLVKRLRSHGSAMANALHVMFEYKTDDLVAVEGCVKQVLKQYQYRKYKEVYEADLDVIKKAIASCGATVRAVQAVAAKTALKKQQKIVQAGGGQTRTFVIFLRDME